MTTGTVAEWNDAGGYGTIIADGVDYFFHCTQLADGTRTTEVGAAVAFEIVPGHLGRWEATNIAKTPSE